MFTCILVLSMDLDSVYIILVLSMDLDSVYIYFSIIHGLR